jgi:hypothetical protein
LAITWLTRCEIGAVDPTHGQFADAADAARAGPAGAASAAEAGPAARDSDAAAAAPRTAIRGRFRRDDMPNEPMMPPDTCFTGVAEGVRNGPWSRGLHAE